MELVISDKKDIELEQIINLYKANKWSSANKPNELHKALMNSHSLISVWAKKQLVGIGNAISDGHLVVYYPHLLVHPDYHRKGIGKMIIDRMQEEYRHFHMQMLTADEHAIEFYKKVGFEKAGATLPMWIYNGNEH